MQGEDGDRFSMCSLLLKIRRLKRKLISYGWSKQEASTFILYEFLKLPEPRWLQPATTASFYDIKEKYKTDPPSSELIIALQERVPNLHTQEVLEYLHSVFQYSSLTFGFEIFDSSSDSSENPKILKRRASKSRPLRSRPRQRSPSPTTKKRIHCEDLKQQAQSSDGEHSQSRKRQQPKRQRREQHRNRIQKKDEIKLVRRRHFQTSFQHEQSEKNIKKDEL